jgi:hypothetical protein
VKGYLVNMHPLLANQVIGERHDVFPAFPQWRQDDGDYVYPIVEVPAERSALYGLFEIPIGGGDQPDIRFNRPNSPHSLELAFLNDTEQFRLQRGGEFS